MLYEFFHKEIKKCDDCPMSNYEGEWCNVEQNHIDDDTIKNCKLMLIEANNEN